MAEGRIKVLYVHHYPKTGGSAISLSLLLKAIDRDKIDARVALIHPKKGETYDFFKSLGLPVDHIPLPQVYDYPWYSYTYIRRKQWQAFKPSAKFAEYLKELKPDLVHLNDTPCLCAGITAKGIGIPVVWHIRGILPHHRWSRVNERVIKHIARLSDLIIGVREDDAAQFPAGSPTVVVYNPLEFEAMDRAVGDRDKVRQSLGISADKCIVAAVVPLVKHKGAFDFIKACGIADRLLLKPEQVVYLHIGRLPAPSRKHSIRRVLRVVGPRLANDYADKLVSRGGIGGKFIFTGFRKDAHAIMNAADIIVYPSRQWEIGRPCLEGNALGKPVINTASKMPTQVVLDGVTAKLVPHNDLPALGHAIADLVNSPDLRSRMGEAGYKHARAIFDHCEYGIRIMHLYRTILAESQKKAGMAGVAAIH